MPDDPGTRAAVDLSESLVNVSGFQCTLFPPLRPRDSSDTGECVLKFLILTAAVEITFEACNVALIAVVTTRFVKDFHEYLQQSVALVLAD